MSYFYILLGVEGRNTNQSPQQYICKKWIVFGLSSHNQVENCVESYRKAKCKVIKSYVSNIKGFA